MQETSRYDEMEHQSQQLQQDINGLLYSKQRQTERLARKQLMLKRCGSRVRGQGWS